MKKAIALFSSVACLVGCVYDTPPPKDQDYSGQTYTEALQMICNVDRMASLAADDDPLSLGRRRTEWIQENVLNAESIYLRTTMSVKGAAEQATLLRDEAKEAQITTCPLADDLEKSGLGGLSP